MIDHGLSIRENKVYLTIPELLDGSVFDEVIVNDKIYTPTRPKEQKGCFPPLLEKVSELADNGHEINLTMDGSYIDLSVYPKEKEGDAK